MAALAGPVQTACPVLSASAQALVPAAFPALGPLHSNRTETTSTNLCPAPTRETLRAVGSSWAAQGSCASNKPQPRQFPGIHRSPGRQCGERLGSSSPKQHVCGTGGASRGITHVITFRVNLSEEWGQGCYLGRIKRGSILLCH